MCFYEIPILKIIGHDKAYIINFKSRSKLTFCGNIFNKYYTKKVKNPKIGLIYNLLIIYFNPNRVIF